MYVPHRYASIANCPACLFETVFYLPYSEVKNEEAIADILCLCCHLYSLLGPDIVIPHTSEEELKVHVLSCVCVCV